MKQHYQQRNYCSKITENLNIQEADFIDIGSIALVLLSNLFRFLGICKKIVTISLCGIKHTRIKFLVCHVTLV